MAVIATADMQNMGLTPIPPELRGLVSKLYACDFAAVQSVWIKESLALLVELRSKFGNDLDKITILSVIGQQMLRDPPISSREARSAPRKQEHDPDTNISAISRASHIPREGVRRKVNELIAEGLVERSASGGLAVRADVATRLAPATMVSIAMLDAIFFQYLGLLREHGLLAANVLPALDEAEISPTADNR